VNHMGRNLITTLIFIFGAPLAHSADIEWSGKYRFEGVFIKNYTLDKSAGVEDSYILNHLILEPKIIATDGINIKSRFDIFNNGLNNSQHGQVFGDYTQPTSSTSPGQGPAVLSKSESSETIAVTELYVNFIHEFGALVVGRVPFQFGLGMLYNSGNGNFDHALSTKDMVGYKLVLGNITIMPGYGKVREGNLLNEDDINDYLVMAEYTNPETDLSMGFLFDQRVAPYDSSGQGNDFPTNYFSNSNTTFGNAIVNSGYSAYNMNFYVKKKWDNFNVGVELGFLNGNSGMKVSEPATGNLDSVLLSGFGGALELGYRTGNIKLNVRTGMASGDDPDTATMEGYAFSPNYHVAMLLFAYPMGNIDVLRSGVWGTHPANYANGNQAISNLGGLDTETISNAIYFSPNLTWSLGEHFDLLGTFCYANLVKPSVSTTSPPAGLAGYGSTSLGFESDFGFSYHPTDKITWETTLGLLFPGSAWAGDGAYATNLAYGATTKAAIGF